MSEREEFEVEEVVEAIREEDGIVSDVARALDTSRTTIYRYRDRHDEVKQALEDADEQVNDLTERKLVEAIEEGEPWAIRFRLKKKARDRGYGDQTDITTGGESFNKGSDGSSGGDQAQENTAKVLRALAAEATDSEEEEIELEGIDYGEGVEDSEDSSD